MEKKVKLIHEDDIIPSIFEGRETKRLITKERENSELCSLHICKVYGPSPWSYDIIYPKNDEIVYLIEGEAQVVFEGERHDWRPGAAIYVPQGRIWRCQAKTELKILVIIAPPRLKDEWGKRTKDHPESIMKDLVLLEPEDAVRKN